MLSLFVSSVRFTSGLMHSSLPAERCSFFLVARSASQRSTPLSLCYAYHYSPCARGTVQPIVSAHFNGCKRGGFRLVLNRLADFPACAVRGKDGAGKSQAPKASIHASVNSGVHRGPWTGGLTAKATSLLNFGQKNKPETRHGFE